MWKSVIFSCLLAFACLPAGVFAAEVGDLYEAEARVFSQQKSERTLAMKAALAEVLVKVSGRSVVLSVDEVKKVLRNPAKLLRLYRYRELTDMEGDAYRAEQSLHPEPKADGTPQMISFSFDKVAVDKLLRENNLPVWGATRPTMLVWLAVQDEQTRYLLGGDSGHSLNQALDSEARRRGLVLLQPLMDLEDRRALRFADVWAGFTEPVLRASARYGSESVLLGRIQPGLGDAWQAQWTVLEGRTRVSWEVLGDSQEQVISKGVFGATELLAARYAPISGSLQAGLLSIMVMGVQDLGDYARVVSYLESLQQVSQMQLEQVEPGKAYFALKIEGAAEGVAKTIALGNVLQVSSNADGPSDGGASAEATGAATSTANSGPKQAYQLLP